MRTSTKRFAVASSVLGVAMVAGCIHPWDEFPALEQSASVWQVSASGSGPGFGEILLGYETPTSVAPTRGTRLYVGGNSGELGVATFASFAMTDESRASGVADAVNAAVTARFRDNVVGSPLFTGCTDLDRERARLRCGAGARSAASVPLVYTSANDLLGCVLVTTGAALRGEETTARDGFQIQCELGANGLSANFPLAQGLGWGASAAGIPRVHEMGIAVLGAPLTRSSEGALFVLRHIRDAASRSIYAGQDTGGGALQDELIIRGLTLQAGDRLGESLAIIRSEANTEEAPFRLATAFGSGANRHVAIVDVRWDAASGTSAQVVGCLSGDGARFGSQLAFGYFNDDNVADLAVGAVDRSEVSGESVVSIFDGTTFNATSCGASAPAATATRAFGCQPNDRVVCTDSQFGYSLAVGDVDGDGKDDLVVGAPRADTDGHVDGGLVQTIPGVTNLASMGEGQRGSLTVGTSTIDSRLGIAVTTIPSVVTSTGVSSRRVMRSDIAASRAAPQGTYVFLCSGLPGDVPGMVDAPMDARVEFGCGLVQDHAPTIVPPAITVESSSNLDPNLHP